MSRAGNQRALDNILLILVNDSNTKIIVNYSGYVRRRAQIIWYTELATIDRRKIVTMYDDNLCNLNF